MNHKHVKDDKGKPNIDASYWEAFAVLNDNRTPRLHEGTQLGELLAEFARIVDKIVNSVVDETLQELCDSVNHLILFSNYKCGIDPYESQSRMCEHGANKYGFSNYALEGVDIGRYCAALGRHALGIPGNPGILSTRNIHALDVDSGHYHMDAVTSNALIMTVLLSKKVNGEDIMNSRVKWQTGYAVPTEESVSD